MKKIQSHELSCTAFVYDRNQFGKPEALVSRIQVKNQDEAHQHLRQMKDQHPGKWLFLITVFTAVPTLICWLTPMLEGFLTK